MKSLLIHGNILLDSNSIFLIICVLVCIHIRADECLQHTLVKLNNNLLM